MITDFFKRLAKSFLKDIDKGKFFKGSIAKKQLSAISSENTRLSPETQWMPQTPLNPKLPLVNQKILDSPRQLDTQTPQATQTPRATQTPIATQKPRATHTPIATQKPSGLAFETPVTRQTSLASRIPLTRQTPLKPRTPLASQRPLAYPKIPRNRSVLYPKTQFTSQTLAHPTIQAMEIIQTVQLVDDSSPKGKGSADKDLSAKQDEKDKEEDLDDMPTWRDPHGRKAIITSKGIGRSINV